MEHSSGAGFRGGPIPSFWVKQGEALNLADSRLSSDSAGCGGAAMTFVLDPDGYNIEAVCHKGEYAPFQRLARTSGGQKSQ